MDLRYCAREHTRVCTACGNTTQLHFEEEGHVQQVELRVSQEKRASAPYQRLKHFRKLLRDIVVANMRIPRRVIERVRAALEEEGDEPSRATVHAALRRMRWYQYYTAEHYIAACLGAVQPGTRLTSNDMIALCRQATRYSLGFDRLRARKLIKRRNFVNASVFLVYLADKEIGVDLRARVRLPSAAVQKTAIALIAQIEASLVFEPSRVTARAKLLTGWKPPTLKLRRSR